MLNHITHTKEIINAAINAVQPNELILNKLKLQNNILTLGKLQFDLANYNNIYVIGTGKASAFMAKEIEKLLGSSIKCGCISTNTGGIEKCDHIKIIEASHPIPYQESIKAGDEIRAIASQAGENDLVICLISGGGSSLMESLPMTVSLEEYQKLTDALIKCGAGIHEINSVRRAISLIKGGNLAKAIYPATCLSLIISDVIGDNLETIASGPTVTTAIDFIDPIKIIEKYNLSSQLSAGIIEHLKNGDRPNNENSNKIEKRIFNIILGNNQTALNAAKIKAEKLGYKTSIFDIQLSGEAREVGTKLGKLVKEKINNKNHCLLFGGETTVTVKGTGKGGRNQELVLAALTDLENVGQKFALASCGTDGKDGPTDAAGALIHENTWDKINEQNLTPLDFLNNNDAYNIHKQINSLIITGPTKTNVMDIQVILVP